MPIDPDFEKNRKKVGKEKGIAMYACMQIREVWDPELDKKKGGAYSYIYEKVMSNRNMA